MWESSALGKFLLVLFELCSLTIWHIVFKIMFPQLFCLTSQWHEWHRFFLQFGVFIWFASLYFRPGSLIIEYEIIVDTSSDSYNADIANGLSEFASNSTITIKNQTVEATEILIKGKECEQMDFFL